MVSGTGTGGVTLSSFTETTAGTKENVECSNKGSCGMFKCYFTMPHTTYYIVYNMNNCTTYIISLLDRTTGTCTCVNGYSSSDGNGGIGRRPDCGYMTELSGTTTTT